ncbi:hypothetical protein QYM36_013668 [Artemia franciscana]|uniref:Reverse transcriptase domain-containing protein n=1 Tax=Artemia franciscana TaxID=6661 RepID=A0AA88L1M5_ARTSF|nr:hypothetical protein QYM36_013668 [Artemia franciscana]
MYIGDIILDHKPLKSILNRPIANRDYLIRDRLVLGVKSDRIREKLLSEGGTLTLARAIEICCAIESEQETQAQMTAANKTSVPVMKQEIDALKKQCNNKECYFCGAPYTKNHNCPARGKTFSKSNKLNHFAKVCKSKGVNEISQQEAGTSASEFMIDTVNSMLLKHADGPDAVIRIVEQKLDLVFKIDTGAEANVLPVSDYNNMSYASATKKVRNRLTSFMCSTLIAKPILSRKTSQNMKLIKFILNVQNEPATSMKPETARILEEYGDVFEGVGKFPGKCKIHLKEGAVPTVQPPKRVPFALQEKLKEELDRLEVMGIIEKTTTPTEWANSIVVVQKPNGSLRICLDPVDLNEWVQRPYHPIPSFDDVAAKCSGSNTFFKLDARQGYWSMELDEESSLLTTFSTTFGRYRWKQYPFGVKSAQDEFQQKMEEVFEGLDIGLIIDDIAGTAANTEDHDAKLRLVLQRAREKGVRFNRDKCIFNALSIPYFGHLLTAEGIKADPEKTKAIANMPAPESHEQLQVLLGMYNYLARYIPNLSSLNHPLRELSKSKTYDWKTQHENAKKQIQASICKNLSYFDHKSRNVEVIVDASQHRLGAQLVVDNKTVAFGSRSLSGAEKRYSQIEKEMLAVTYTCKHFRQYIYGRTTTVTTDHKPLESILKKPISKAQPRLRRMMIAVQNYDIQVIYRPGSEIPVADVLSRLHLPETDPDTQHDSEFADQTVWVKLDHNARWQKALILEKYENAPRSYILQTENGKGYRRNRRQIRERNQRIEHPHSIPSSPKNFPMPPRATTTPAERFATPLADAATAESPSRSPSHLTQRPRQPLCGTTRSGRITKPPTRLNL